MPLFFMPRPHHTRLRYVQSKKPEKLVQFLASIPFRVQIYGAPVWDGKLWTLWFVPQDDISKDVKSGLLD